MPFEALVDGPILIYPPGLKERGPYPFTNKVDNSGEKPKLYFNVIYRRDSSRSTFVNTSRVDGRGFRSRILYLTASNLRFRPARNSYTFSFSSFFLYLVLSPRHSHSSSMLRSSSYERATITIIFSHFP